jgi:hypothetical protein
VAFSDASTAYAIVTAYRGLPPIGVGAGGERLLRLRSHGTSWKLEPRDELLDRGNSTWVTQCEKRR